MQDRKKAVQYNSVPLFVLQLFKLMKFKILRNYLLHQDISVSGGIGGEFFKCRIFCGTAGFTFADAADFAAINPQCSDD